MKIIKTNGITYLEILSEGSEWYCGTDYACGDLYEAEEVYQLEKSCRPNRLIFVHHPDGTVYEPILLKEGQYFGRPAEMEGRIYILLVDFNHSFIRILECMNDFSKIVTVVEISLEEVEDCYNLLLHGNPLMLTREGGENHFQVIWPVKVDFIISPRESFLYKKGDKFYFSEWQEDPDYREEIVIRRDPSGEIVERIKGSIFIPPSRESWILQ